MTTAELIRWHEDRARDHRLDYATIEAHRQTVAALRRLQSMDAQLESHRLSRALENTR